MTRDEYSAEKQRHGETMGRLIDSLLQAQPFRPFRIHMTGRSVYEITEPGMVKVRKGVAEIKPDQPGWAILALEHVVSLTVLPPVDEPVIVKQQPMAETRRLERT
jgi:hypothetical protein